MWRGLWSQDWQAVGHCINEPWSRMLILVMLGIVPGSCRRPHSADWAWRARVNWFVELWFACYWEWEGVEGCGNTRWHCWWRERRLDCCCLRKCLLTVCLVSWNSWFWFFFYVKDSICVLIWQSEVSENIRLYEKYRILIVSNLEVCGEGIGA